MAVDGEEIITLTRSDFRMARDAARAVIRDALATLGGVESMRAHRWPRYGADVVYVISARNVEQDLRRAA